MPPNDPQFNIGETPEGIATVQRAQLAYPLDAESLSTLKLGLESIQKEVIIRHDRVTFTLASGATTFDVASNYMVITGDGGANTVATIGGGREGMTLTLEFIDANVTITDVSSAAVDTVNLNGSSVNFTSAANVILQLQHDGISWRELARSTNVTADHGGLSGLADDDHTQYITDITSTSSPTSKMLSEAFKVTVKVVVVVHVIVSCNTPPLAVTIGSVPLAFTIMLLVEVINLLNFTHKVSKKSVISSEGIYCVTKYPLVIVVLVGASKRKIPVSPVVASLNILCPASILLLDTLAGTQ